MGMPIRIASVKRRDHQVERLREPRPDLVDDRPLGRDRVAEVALEDVAQPAHVLVGEDRLVEAEACALGLEELGVRRKVRQDLGVDRGEQRVTRRELERDEPDERDPQQDGDRDEQATNDVGAHRASYAISRRRPVGAHITRIAIIARTSSTGCRSSRGSSGTTLARWVDREAATEPVGVDVQVVGLPEVDLRQVLVEVERELVQDLVLRVAGHGSRRLELVGVDALAASPDILSWRSCRGRRSRSRSRTGTSPRPRCRRSDR